VHKPTCRLCCEPYPAGRAALGYDTCLDCGDAAAASERAAWCISLAGHKQGYTLITRKEQLKEINKYAQS